jgi:hypothetical protein
MTAEASVVRELAYSGRTAGFDRIEDRWDGARNGRVVCVVDEDPGCSKRMATAPMGQTVHTPLLQVVSKRIMAGSLRSHDQLRYSIEHLGEY